MAKAAAGARSTGTLVEVPHIERLARAEIEARLTVVRSKRMAAAVVYHQGRNAKLRHEQAVIQRRINQQLDLLEKELIRLEAAADKASTRADKIEVMRHNAGLAADMLTVLDKEDETP